MLFFVRLLQFLAGLLVTESMRRDLCAKTNDFVMDSCDLHELFSRDEHGRCESKRI